MKTSDLIYLETDDSCAICGTKGIDVLSEHHIDSDRSNNEYDNLIVLCHNCHHKITNGKELSKTKIEERKRHLIHKTMTTYGLNALKIARRNKFGVIAIPSLSLGRLRVYDQGRKPDGIWRAERRNRQICHHGKGREDSREMVCITTPCTGLWQKAATPGVGHVGCGRS